MEKFTLRKSYLDVVDATGRCAILYSAEIGWGSIAAGWDAVSLYEPGQPARHRSAWRTAAASRGVAPAARGRAGGIEWRSEALGCRAACVPSSPAFAARLLDTVAGTLDWSCDAPGAAARFETDQGTAIEGAGYAERVVLAMPPWKLPIDELRWGRWVEPATKRSIVWIDWTGETRLALVLENGVRQADAAVGERSVHCAAGTLELSAARAIYSRTLAEALGGVPLVNRLPARWRALEDRKTLSRGTLGSQSGWAIHETVRFP